MPVQVRIEGLEQMLRKLGPQFIAKPMKDFWQRCGITVQSAARERANRDAHDTGHLVNMIQYEVDTRQVPLWAKVGLLNASAGSPLWFKARAMEYGTGRMGDTEVSHKSGHWPPGAALDTWASRHGFASGAQVAAIIGKRGGLKPRRFLRGGFDDSLSKIRGYLRQLGDDIRSAWEKR